MRTAHYWRKAGAQSTPSEIVVFDCETWHGERAAITGGELQTLRLGHAVAYRMEKGKRTRQQRMTFRTAAEFWSFVESRLSKSRPVWVFAHNIAYDLGCVGGWRWINGGRFTPIKQAVSGTLFFLKGTVGKFGLVFCDTCNYFRSSLASLGKAVGLPKMTMPHQDAPDAEWEVYCRNDVDVTALAVDKLIAFLRGHGLGPWQPSIAGLSFSAYRACFMKDKVLVHSYPSILRLEREAYYGGIVDTPHIGRVDTGPIYELDVCSMYPAVCRSDLPIKYKGDSRRYGLEGVRRLAETFSVCASVEIESQTTPYPIRQRRGTYFVTGSFHTTLAHPELMLAIHRGHVRHVNRVVWYTRGPIFRDYMIWFTDKKLSYNKPEDEAFRHLCKMYNTNLYGKTGQKTPIWREWGEDALKQIEQRNYLKEGTLEHWYEKPPDLYDREELFKFPMLDAAFEVRDYLGIVEIKIGECESRDSCPIIAATVTSYARVLLRRYQEIAGRGHWYYSDTDSIWVDETGLKNLQHLLCVQQDTLGYLSIKAVHDWLHVHGAKDYETPTCLKRKGVRLDAEPNGDGGWRQLHFPSAYQQIKDGYDDGVFVRKVTKHLYREVTKYKVLPDGKTRPLIFPEENPERGK